MADIKQNVNYEITAQDKTGEATDSALANLIRQEQAAKKANQDAQKQANETKGLFAAITNALSVNFQALGEQVAQAAAKLAGFKTGAKSHAFASRMHGVCSDWGKNRLKAGRSE